MTDRPDDLGEAFARAHGATPTALATAPGRINLIGEHLDYNGGRVLPVALALTTSAAARLRDDRTVTVRSRQQDEPWTSTVEDLSPEEERGWWSYVSGVLWAMRERGVDVAGIDVLVDGHVPLGAGLSSSAALECSVALAVARCLDLPDDEETRRALVDDCIRAEREVAGAPTGGMDQMVSMLATEGHALLYDTASGATSHVPWRPEDSGHTLLVIDTRASHALNDGGYASRRASCEDAARRLGVDLLSEVTDHAAALDALADDPLTAQRVRHVLTEMERVDAAVDDLEAGDLASFGRRLTESHASLRDDYEVSCVELDVTVDTCLAHGALGARMTGGGFGGSAIALVRAADAEAVLAAVREAYAGRGWPEPGTWQTEAGPGARSWGAP